MNSSIMQIKNRSNSRKIGITIDINLSHDRNSIVEKEIRKLLFEHKVVVIKNQELSDTELLNFALIFGPIFDSNKAHVLGSKNGKNTELVVVGNNASEYKDAYLGCQEVLPHSDHQWVEEPSSVSMLYAIDVDKTCAPTKWTDTTAIYKSLPKELKDAIATKQIITFNPFYRPFGEVSAKYVNRDVDIPPGEQISHPLVRVHPITQEKILYMHRAYEMEFEGMPFEKGVALWEKLNHYIDTCEDVYEHQWEKGDLVIWDNRATLHYRRQFDAGIRRVLKRVSISGEKPFRK